MTRLLALLFALALPAAAAVPRMLHHQGRMAVDGAPFDGTGRFKFALVEPGGAANLWSHDATATGEPATAVSVPVSRGLYSVLLGEPPMAPLDPLVFTASDVRLRVWFDDGVHGFQKIEPDQRLVAAPYALAAARVDEVMLADVKAAPAVPVVAWGRNSENQTKVPAALTGANTAMISAKGANSLALLKTGTVVQWGGGAPPPAGLTQVVAISAGVHHALAIQAGGVPAAWGDNSYGQCDLAGLAGATAIAAGEKHSVVLLAGGVVAARGDGTFGQTAVPALAGVSAIAAGYDHSLALTAAGAVVAWGRNDAGQCDVPEAALNGVVAIAAGAHHSLAVKHDGSVVAWGWDSAGQASVPAGLSGVRAVAAGYAFSAALRNDGGIVVWGDGSDGQRTVPPEAVELAAVSAGDAHVLGLHRDVIPARIARLDQANTFGGRLGIRRSAAVNALEVEGNASKTTAGSWLANSDARIKTEVSTLTGALETLDRVRLVDFRYTAGYRAAHPDIEDRRYPNVIAQEFAAVFPDDVKGSGELLADGGEILQVDTYPLTIYSAAAIQELHRENRALKQQLAAQEERLRRLEQALGK